MSKSILYDATMCIDCKACEQACATHAGLPYDDKIAAEEYQSAHKLTAVLNKSDKYMRRLCHALRRAGLRFGMSRGGAGEDRTRSRDLRRAQVHGMPLLHGGLSVHRPQVRMGKAVAPDSQVHHVLRPRVEAASDGLHRSLPHRGHEVRRARRTAEGSAGAHR